MDLTFTPLSEKDFDTLIGWAESPRDLLLWAGPALVYPLTHQKLAEYLAPSKQQNPKMFAFAARAGDEVVGMAELAAVDKVGGTGTLCRIYVDKNCRGKGISEFMIEKLLKLGFDELGLHRIDLRVYANNSPAIKSYVKLGFVKEGCLRKAAKFENEFWDVLIYSMLYDEWKKS